MALSHCGVIGVILGYSVQGKGKESIMIPNVFVGDLAYRK